MGTPITSRMGPSVLQSPLLTLASGDDDVPFSNETWDVEIPPPQLVGNKAVVQMMLEMYGEQAIAKLDDCNEELENLLEAKASKAIALNELSNKANEKRKAVEEFKKRYNAVQSRRDERRLTKAKLQQDIADCQEIVSKCTKWIKEIDDEEGVDQDFIADYETGLDSKNFAVIEYEGMVRTAVGESEEVEAALEAVKSKIERLKVMMKGLTGRELFQRFAIPFQYDSHKILHVSDLRTLSHILKRFGFGIGTAKLDLNKQKHIPQWRKICEIVGIEIPANVGNVQDSKPNKIRKVSKNIDFSKFM